MVNPGRKLKKILLILGIAGAVYGGFKILLPLVIPFLLAYAAALWMRPSVRYFEKRLTWKMFGKTWYMPVGVIGAAEMLLILGILLALVYFGGAYLIGQLERLTALIPQGLSWLDVRLTGLCRNMEHTLGLRPEYLVAGVREMLQEIGSAVRDAFMPAIMNNSVAVITKLIEAIVLLILFFIATLMFLQEMDEIRERKNRSMFHREFALIGRRLVLVGSAWIKAEAVIVLVTSALCTLGLLLIGSSYALVFGIGIGVLDALPLFGSGVVLIPWGIFLLLQRRWVDGIILMAVYVLCYFLRQILEARLMGDQMGLSPVETLVSMYVGLRLFGLAGFLLGPIGLLMVGDLVELYWREE